MSPEAFLAASTWTNWPPQGGLMTKPGLRFAYILDAAFNTLNLRCEEVV